MTFGLGIPFWFILYIPIRFKLDIFILHIINCTLVFNPKNIMCALYVGITQSILFFL